MKCAAKVRSQRYLGSKLCKHKAWLEEIYMVVWARQKVLV